MSWKWIAGAAGAAGAAVMLGLGPGQGHARAAGPAPVRTMTATAYGPSLRDNFPFGPVNFFGQPLVAGDVAVDPRVIPLGTRLYITGYHSPYLPAPGFYAVACDTGDAITGDRLDIFINGSPAQVAAFGLQRVKVQVLPAAPAAPVSPSPAAGLLPVLDPPPAATFVAESPWRQSPARA